MNTEPKLYTETELAAAVHQARIETHNGICEQINAAHAAHNEAINALHQYYQSQWKRDFDDAVKAAVTKALNAEVTQ